jgi:hypothetical protein
VRLKKRDATRWRYGCPFIDCDFAVVASDGEGMVVLSRHVDEKHQGKTRDPIWMLTVFPEDVA